MSKKRKPGRPNVWDDRMKQIIPLIQQQYTALGGPITVRRTYYVALSVGVVTNTAYGQISDQVARAREEGSIPWEWIIDESRDMIELDVYPSHWFVLPDPEISMNDPTTEQEYYVEVWIEKAGSIPIIKPICKKYYVPIVSSSGRASVSFKYRAGKRFEEALNRGQKIKMLYISDLDADGDDFPVEVKRYMKRIVNVDVDVEKILLTMDQVNNLNLPQLKKSYVKRKNVQFVKDFTSKYGDIQVELDAMPIPDIQATLEFHLKKYIDPDIIDQVKQVSVEEATVYLADSVAEYEADRI